MSPDEKAQYLYAAADFTFSMAFWLPESLTPEYQETLEIVREGAKKHGAFGRFTGRRKTTLTWNEWVVYNWLRAHGYRDIIHNYTVWDDAPEGYFRSKIPYEFDFYIPTLGIGIEVDPLFHYDTGNPVTRGVMMRDTAKDQWARDHGIHLIRVVAYDKPEDFAAEIMEKLRPLATH
jgi:hypothetical protein